MYEILKKKKKFRPTDRPISEKQGRERGKKNIFKVGLKQLQVEFFQLQTIEFNLKMVCLGVLDTR